MIVVFCRTIVLKNIYICSKKSEKEDNQATKEPNYVYYTMGIPISWDLDFYLP